MYSKKKKERFFPFLSLLFRTDAFIRGFERWDGV